MDLSKWTLFIDRDGVLNRHLPGDYVTHVGKCEIVPGAFVAMGLLQDLFTRLVIVSNQRGVKKGLMTKNDLDDVNNYIRESLNIRKEVHFLCATSQDDLDYKPNIGLGIRAKVLMPLIDFRKSIIVGDNRSDILFGRKLGMICVGIRGELLQDVNCDYYVEDLLAFTNLIVNEEITF